jgi:hypothetical protein
MAMNTLATIEEWRFLCGLCQEVTTRTVCQLRVQFCMGGCEDRISMQEAEESPLLDATAREWLVKT